MDLCGPLHNFMYLLVIDAHTKWPEVANMKNNTKSDNVITFLKTLFARFGLPKHLVTDNGPQFTSEEMKDFCRTSNIKHSFSPPYHPATNSAAENFVSTFKSKLTKIIKSGKDAHSAVQLFLFDYRTTEQATTGKTPAKLMFNRELFTRFNILRVKPVTMETEEKPKVTILREFQPNELVYVNEYANNKCTKLAGKVLEKLSPVTYTILINDNVVKRHIDQIIRSDVRKSNRQRVKNKKYNNDEWEN